MSGVKIDGFPNSGDLPCPLWLWQIDCEELLALSAFEWAVLSFSWFVSPWSTLPPATVTGAFTFVGAV
jgi:hypothetical protein